MRPFTLVMAYYDNPGMLEVQLQHIRELPPEIRSNLSMTVVDDGSPRWPAEDVCQGIRATNFGFYDGLALFQLYRMDVDIPWNQDACRNIGVKHARDWVLLTDMDHVVPEATWRRLMWGDLERKRAYRFGRVSAPAMTPYKLHPNTWAMRAKVYWKAGGYDETLAGNYGTDGDFLRRVGQVAAIEELPEVVIRYPREVVPDASTTTLERKNPQQKAAIQQAFRDRALDRSWKPQHFRFPYVRVL